MVISTKNFDENFDFHYSLNQASYEHSDGIFELLTIFYVRSPNVKSSGRDMLEQIKKRPKNHFRRLKSAWK